MKRFISVLFCAIVLFVSAPSARLDESRDISETSVRAHLEFLASDALNGRGSGTRDEWIAAEYIGSQLRLSGLEPLGGDGYLQTVDIERVQLAKPPILSFGTGRFTHGDEIIVSAMSAAKHTGPLQKFQPGGTVAPGSALLLPEGVLQRDVPGANAAAIVLAMETPQARQQWTALAGRPLTLGARLTAVPAAGAQVPARVILDKAAYASIAALPAGTTISIDGETAAPETSQTWNAVAQLKGRDGSQTREVILLSAHLDHIGNRASRGGATVPGADTINNGADDDASGCVAVMEIAKALASGKRPKRTIVFAFFGSEEAGGFGSRYFADKPAVPLPQIIANLQFEMIGRPDSAVPPKTLWLTGYERSTLGPSLAKHGARLVQDPHPAQNFFFRSDNIHFALRGVVAHTVSSYGLHKEYHTVEDETRLVDYAHMTEAIRSMVKPIEWLANSDFKPTWLPGRKP